MLKRNSGTVILLALIMVACSQPNSSSSTGDPETGSLAKGADLAEAHQQAPTTVAGLDHALIKHGFGETMVALPAERVVVLQANDEDYLIALGIEPVAISSSLNGDELYSQPWLRSAYSGGFPVNLGPVTAEPDYALIASLEPDLILARQSNVGQEVYDALSAVAPTVAEPLPQTTGEFSWQEKLRFVGKAVGLEAEAEHQILIRQASILDAIRPFPSLKGSTFARIKKGSAGAWQIAGGSSASARFLKQLGLAFPSDIDDEVGASSWVSIHKDISALISVDVAVVNGNPSDAEWLGASFPGLNLENIVWIEEQSLTDRALNSVTILSAEWLLDELVPRIAELVTVVLEPPTEDESAAMEAFRLVYGSETEWNEKQPHLENASQLRNANQAYRIGAEDNGGITLRPKSAQIEGNKATVVYDVYFGDAPAYNDLQRSLYLVEGIWQVTESDFCDFLSAAQTPCG